AHAVELALPRVLDREARRAVLEQVIADPAMPERPADQVLRIFDPPCARLPGRQVLEGPRLDEFAVVGTVCADLEHVVVTQRRAGLDHRSEVLWTAGDAVEDRDLVDLDLERAGRDVPDDLEFDLEGKLVDDPGGRGT